MVTAIRCAAMALNFGVQLVMARVMTLSAFGTANTALALLSILVIPASLGYETVAIRYVALVRDDLPFLRTLTLQFIRTVAISSTVTCAVVGLGAIFECLIGHRDQAIAMAALIVIIPGFALVKVGEGWLRGRGSVVRALVNSGVVIPVVSITLVVGLWLLGGRGQSVGIMGALGARAVATAVAVATVGVFLWGKLKHSLTPRGSVEPTLTAEIRRAALVLCGVATLTMALNQLDIVAVSLFKGAAQAGLYSAASRVAQAMGIVLVAVNFILAPRIARLYAFEKTEQLQQEIYSAANWTAAIMVIVCVLIIPASPLILSIFGSSFTSAADALRILMAGQLVNAFCGPAGGILNMTGRQSSAILILGVSTLFDIALFGFLIPPLGLSGAAIASSLSTATWNLAMVAYIRRDMGLWSLPGRLVRLFPER